MTRGHCYEYPLRPDFVAQLVIPRELTERDARRLCAFIQSLVMPTSDD